MALEIDVPSDLPPVQVDEDRIGQVLLNLVGNALQYTPAGGEVCLRARREGGMVRLAVEDTGIGIAPEHLPHVFERFYRVDKSRSRAGGGSGIGLTIARHLVEAHGGQIGVTSDGRARAVPSVLPCPLPERIATSPRALPHCGAALFFFTESLHSLHGSFNRACYTVLSNEKTEVQPLRCTETKRTQRRTT